LSDIDMVINAVGTFKHSCRQTFADLRNYYADDLLLKPSTEARASALAEVMEVAELLLGIRDTAGAAARPPPLHAHTPAQA
jgi:hypothetical protein